MRKRIDPATPLALPSYVWSLAVKVTIVMAKLSVHPMKKTPKETSAAARALVFGVQVATPGHMSVNVVETTMQIMNINLHAKKIPPSNSVTKH